MIKLYCDKCGKELKWNQGAKQRIKDCYDDDLRLFCVKCKRKLDKWVNSDEFR